MRLKILGLTAIISTIWIPCFAKIAVSNQQNVSSPYPTVPDADLDMLICYLRTEKGQILDLGNLCGNPVKKAKDATAKAADIKRLLETQQCSGCDLSGVNLSGAKLNGTNLMNANLSGANLTGATLIGANLNDANLAGTNLSGAQLNGARMMRANLNGANLVDANLLGANIINADLNGAKLDAAKMPDGTISK